MFRIHTTGRDARESALRKQFGCGRMIRRRNRIVVRQWHCVANAWQIHGPIKHARGRPVPATVNKHVIKDRGQKGRDGVGRARGANVVRHYISRLVRRGVCGNHRLDVHIRHATVAQLRKRVGIDSVNIERADLWTCVKVYTKDCKQDSKKTALTALTHVQVAHHHEQAIRI